MLKVSELYVMSNAEIIAQIYKYGIIMCDKPKPRKCDEESLKRAFKELERRGVLEDWEQAYELTKKP